MVLKTIEKNMARVLVLPTYRFAPHSCAWGASGAHPLPTALLRRPAQVADKVFEQVEELLLCSVFV